ncbi:unnamed protein product [Durusdinium trenchii]|uniref:Guanylate cyclase domain-containing protein n=1 Tax=Durusdinium trenchii TaxID=1381693 RepID=A0ABP0S4S8_9DINO
MIFAVKAYMGERSLREQFKARHAIDEAKSRIEDILDTLKQTSRGVYIKTDEKGKTKQYKSKKQAKEHGFSEETRLNSVFLSLSIFLLARPICRLRPALSPLKDAVTPKPESIVGNACGSDTVGKAEDLLKMGQGNGDQQLSSFGQSGKADRLFAIFERYVKDARKQGTDLVEIADLCKFLAGKNQAARSADATAPLLVIINDVGSQKKPANERYRLQAFGLKLGESGETMMLGCPNRSWMSSNVFPRAPVLCRSSAEFGALFRRYCDESEMQIQHHYHRATLVQSDLIGFTRMASLKPPEAVVKAVSVPSLGWPGCRREVSRAERRSSGVCAELQPADLFGLFDGLADEYGIYKVETVGDAYIAGQAEPPLTLDNYPPNVIRFGLKMIGDSDETIGVRVGVHSGECIGGIVGIDKQRYHLFGQLIHQLELLEPPGLVSSSCKAAVEAAWASDTHTHREENLSVSSCLRFDFVERPEKHLVTSKGEVHQYAEVGGHLCELGPVHAWSKVTYRAGGPESRALPLRRLSGEDRASGQLFSANAMKKSGKKGQNQNDLREWLCQRLVVEAVRLRFSARGEAHDGWSDPVWPGHLRVEWSGMKWIDVVGWADSAREAVTITTLTIMVEPSRWQDRCEEAGMEGKCLGEMLRGGGPVPGRGPVFSPKITMDMEKGVLGVKMFDLGSSSAHAIGNLRLQVLQEVLTITRHGIAEEELGT